MNDLLAIQTWLTRNPLTPEQVDCATAVMLKILDGKCKMNAAEKPIMRALYHAVKQQPGRRLSDDLHRTIAAAEQSCNDEFRERIYEQRVLAETIISRPVMKAFKRQIRDQGLFTVVAAEGHL